MKGLKKLVFRAALITGISSCAVFDPSIVPYESIEGNLGFKLVNKANENWKETDKEKYLWIGKPERFSYKDKPIQDTTLFYQKEKNKANYFFPKE